MAAPKSELLDAAYPWDIEINGHGYLIARQIIPNLPFRTQRAKYGYTPTFIERTNVSNGYGDNQQDFWLTISQNDWSLGGGQIYFDANDSEKSRKCYSPINTSILKPGSAIGISTPTTIVGASASDVLTGAFVDDTNFYSATSSHLYQYDTTGAVTDRGAHGLSVVPTTAAFDGDFLYISAAGASSVRKYNTSTHAFASFSASAAESLLYLNNTLYGIKAGVFYTYASGGTASASFTFKDASGSALTGYTSALAALGGKVLVLRTGPQCSSLWQWDGSGMSMLAQFPNNFLATDLDVVDGIVFVIGFENGNQTSIWFYQSGNIGRTYLCKDTSGLSTPYTSGAAIAAYGDGFVFSDPVLNGDDDRPNGTTSGAFVYYDISEGAWEIIATNDLVSGNFYIFGDTGTRALRIAANQNGWIAMLDATDTGTAAETGLISTVTGFYPPLPEGWLVTSLYDFGSSLDKYMLGITLDIFNPRFFGGSFGIDVYYQLNGITPSSWTLLTNSITPGEEILLPANTVGKSISFAIGLNRHDEFHPPSSHTYTVTTLRRIYVRAAPIQTQFRTGEYVLDMSGRDGKTPVMKRDGRPDARTGTEMLNQLLADITSTTPFTITDRLGTFTGVAELDQLEVIELKPEEYWVRLLVRGV